MSEDGDDSGGQRVNLYLQAQRRRQAGKLAATFADPEGVQPDTMARAYDLAGELGVGAFELARNKPFMERMENQRRNAEELFRAPSLMRFVDAPDTAALSKDELGTLAQYENIFRRDPAGQNPAGTGVGRAAERGVLTLRSAAPAFRATAIATTSADAEMNEEDFVQDVFLQTTPFDEVPPGVDVSSREAAINFLEEEGFSAGTVTNFMQVYEKRKSNAEVAAGQPEDLTDAGVFALTELNRLKDEAAAIPMSPAAERMKESLAEDQTLLGTGLALLSDPAGGAAFLGEVAAESAPVIAPALLAAAASRSPALGNALLAGGALTQEVGAEGQQFLNDEGIVLSSREDALELLANESLLQEATQQGVVRGVVIAAFELIGQGAMSQVADGAGTAAGTTVRSTVLQGATGSAGELAAQVAAGQDINLQEVLIEGLAEAVLAPAEYAVARRVERGRLRDATRAIGQASKVEDINNIVERTKLRKRSSRAYRSFLQQGGFNRRSIYFDPDAVAEAAADSPSIYNALGTDEKTVAKMSEEGRRLSVRLDTYMQNVPGRNRAAERLAVEHGTLDAPAMTKAEGQSYMDEGRQERAQETSEAQQELGRVETVRRDIVDAVSRQLRAAGLRQTEGAQLWGSALTTLAQRTGRDPADFARMFNIDIRGPASPEARDEQGRRVQLSPSTDETPTLMTGGRLNAEPVAVDEVDGDTVRGRFVGTGEVFEIPTQDVRDGFYVFQTAEGQPALEVPDPEATPSEAQSGLLSLSDDLISRIFEDLPDSPRPLNRLNISREEVSELRAAGVDISDDGFVDYKTAVGLLDERHYRAGTAQRPASPDAGSEDGEGVAQEPRRLEQRGLPLFDDPLEIEGKVTVKKIGQAMTDAHMDEYGRKLYPEDSEADYEEVVNVAADELDVQMQRPNSGAGWYSKDVELAIANTAQAYPEISTPEGRAVWLTFAGIFSNGLDPAQAWEISAEAFDYWLAFGEIPTNRGEAARALGREPKMTTFKDNKTGEKVTRPAGWGVRNAANEQQLTMLKNLVEREGGPVEARDWMLSLQDPEAINEVVLTAQNTPRFKTKKEREGPPQWGALIFSDKLGRYTMGLHGFQVTEDDTTVDLWYTRTYRRLTGRLMDKPIGKEGVAAQPDPERGGVERKTIFRMTGDLMRRFGDLSAGDVQAMLWFFEKRLWGAQGLRVDEGTNSAGAKRLLEKRGLTFDERAGRPAQDQEAGADAGGAGRGEYSSGGLTPLEGAPNVVGASGPDAELVAVAEQYAQRNGIDLRRQSDFVEVDPERATRIAEAYEAMEHAPQDPAVQEAYNTLIEQTVDQYQALVDAGYTFTFFDSETDPYNGNPWNAMRDLRANKSMAVYGTYDGYGSDGLTQEAIDDNPMLQDTGIVWKDQNGADRPVTANDLFRAVHDAFGHGIEGAGFRARGEENAWQAHVRLFTGSAVAAITSETRGQNSWLNYGPYGEQNRTASVEDTVFADQKIGLMPEFTWSEGRAGDMPSQEREDGQSASTGRTLYQRGVGPEDLPDDGRGEAERPAAAGEGEGAPAGDGQAVQPVTGEDLENIDDPDVLADFLQRPGWTVITATREDLPDVIKERRNEESNERLRRTLEERGLPYVTVRGRYKGTDQGTSFLVVTDEATALNLGRTFSQESVLTSEGLIYSRPQPATPATGDVVTGEAATEEDFFSETEGGTAFSMGLDFDRGPGVPVIPEGYSVDPSRPQLPVRPDGFVELHHWSDQELTEVDPQKAGTGPLKGAERRRGARLAFFGVNPRGSQREPGTGYVKESGLGDVEHVTFVRPDELYPIFEDPEGIVSGMRIDEAEDAIKAAGYKGYYTTDDGSGRAPHGNAAALFEAQGVVSIEQFKQYEAEQARLRAEQYSAPFEEDLANIVMSSDGVGTAQAVVGDDSRLSDKPVVVTRMSNGQLYLLDGYHRAVRASQLGRTSIQVVERTPNEDLQERVQNELELSGAAQDIGAPLRPAREALRQISEDGPRGEIRIPAEGILSGETVIEMFKSSDPSTFLHESGHYFLEVLQEVGRMDDAPQQIRDDLTTINRWLGRADDDMSTFSTQEQEAWAEAFETYLMEGKAPSPSLKVAFRQFARWLADLYTRLSRRPGVAPSPEIREVMDRLLATDEEIAVAREVHDSKALFKDIPPGMSQAEWEPYERLVDREEAETQGRVLERAMAKIRRRRTKEYKKRFARLEEEVRESLKEERAYRVIEGLGNGEFGKSARLDKKQLVDRFGEQVLQDLDRKRHKTKTNLYVEQGTDIDIVADTLGYDDVGQMITDLRAAKPIKEAVQEETRRRVENELGDPDDEVSIKEEAEAALKHATASERVAREAATLGQQATGSRGPNRWQQQNAAAKVQAEENVDAMTVREVLGYRQFLRASQKASREAQRQLATVVRRADGTPQPGSRDALNAAAEAKRRQLLNDHMYRVAREKARRYEAARKRFSRMQKRSIQQNIGAEFMDVINSLLDQYSFRQLAVREVKRRGDIRELYRKMIEENRGAELAIPADVLARVEPIHYTELTSAELDGVVDAIDNAAHMGRATTKQIAAEEALDMGLALDAIEERGDKNLKDGDLARERGERKTWGDFGRQFMLHVLNADTILRDIDGDETALGPAYNAIKKAIDTGVANADARRQQAAKDIVEIYRRNLGEHKNISRLRNDKRAYPELGGESLTKLGLISMALNAGNETNWERLTNPNGKGTYEAGALKKVLVRELSENEWRFVQDMWDYIDSYWAEISAQERKYTGVTPKKVRSKLMIEGAPDFVTGGYYPIRYDYGYSTNVDDIERAKLATEGTVGVFGKAQTSNGHAQERLASTGRPVDLSLDIIDNHVYNVIHDLELRGPIRDAARIVYSERFGDMMVRKNRAEDTRALKAWLEDTAVGDKVGAYGASRWFRWMRGGFTLSAIGFKISTIMIQPLGLTQSLVQVGYGNMTRGYAQYLKQGPARMHRMALEKSSIMQERIRTFDRDISQITENLAAGAALEKGYQRVVNFYLPYAYTGMQHMQYWVVDLPTWLASYEGALRNGSTDEEAVTIADRDVRIAQGSGLMSDRGMLERGRFDPSGRPSELPRLFTVLGSYMFGKFNLAYRRARGTDFKDPVAIAKLSRDFAMLFVVEAVLVYLLRNGWPDEEDDEPPMPLIAAREGLYTAMGTMPVVRDVGSALQGFGGGNAYSEYTGAMQSLFSGVGDLGSGEVDRKTTEGLLGFGGTAFFLPSGQLNDMLDAIWTKDFEVEDDWIANLLESMSGLPVGGENES